MAADLTNRSSAVYVLLIGTIQHYGYVPFEPELRGIMSKAFGGLAMLMVVPFLWRSAPSKLMALVLAWWVFENLQVFLCSVAYAIKPWEVALGQSICSARFDLDLGAIGIMLVSIIVWRICQPVKSDNAIGRKDLP